MSQIESPTSLIPVPDQPNAIDASIQLGVGFSATQEFYAAIFQRAKSRMQTLPRDGIYTAAQLAGKKYWDLMDSGDQRLAGQCIAHMVRHGSLPLTIVKGVHEYPLRYRLQ